MSSRIVPAAFVLMLLVAAAQPVAAQPEVGGQAPAFSLSALDGATVSLEDYRGRTVVLHFGAGW
jgi:hypothetical protein